jgi:hypothetical protein
MNARKIFHICGNSIYENGKEDEKERKKWKWNFES